MEGGSGRRPGWIDGHPFTSPFPGEPGGGASDRHARILKGFGIGTKTVQPAGAEIIMNGLTRESADVEPGMVELDGGLWPGGPQQGRSGDEIVQSDRCCIGLEAD